MQILNYTPHTIIYITKENEYQTITSNGVARCKEKISEEIEIKTDDGYFIRLEGKEFSEIEGLPEQRLNQLIIVSNIVINANEQSNSPRGDLIAPSDIVRNEDGQIIGCKAFSKPWKRLKSIDLNNY